MKRLRIVLLSRSRPSRTWNLARRIAREVPEAWVCGIVQQPMHRLRCVQQLIATRYAGSLAVSPGVWSRAGLLVRSLLEEVMHWAIWFVHGCPRGLNSHNTFTVADLFRACRRTRCPFLLAEDFNDPDVLNFIRRRADLAVALDQVSPDLELLRVPPRGLVRVSQGPSRSTADAEAVHIRVEHFAAGCGVPSPIATLEVPFQPYDGLLGLTLKTGLITGDLLLETARGLSHGTPEQAAKEVTAWIERMYAPYLGQLQQASHQTEPIALPRRRYRRTWKLCLDTLLLCSPLVLLRNWYHRFRGRYPVVILTHHLVSDRPHRMALPTEQFWRQVRFLQRHYRIVSLAEAAEMLCSGTVTAPTVVLTFDDGYGDNFTGLRAVADETGIPVTLFLVSQPIELQQEFQHDVDWGITGFLPLTWDQVRYWQERGAEFGSHTRTHPDCGAVDPATLESEIMGSRNDLESQLDVPVRFFAFPFGAPRNIPAQAMRMAASAYSHFVSGFGGENVPLRNAEASHLFRKKLYPGLWELEMEIHSVFDLVDFLRRKFHFARHQAAGAPAPATPIAASHDAPFISRAGD